MSYEHYHKESQHPEDVEVLEWALGHYKGQPCRFLEIGVLNGQTARGIKQFCDENKIELEYWGIDPVSPEKWGCPREPFPGANFIQGDSAESFHLAEGPFEVALIDGCHCVNHVILDTIHYGAKVAYGGYLLFHDTNPEIQNTMRDPHGPDIWQFHNSVLEALTMIRFPTELWHYAKDSDHVEGRKWGGMTCFRKRL